MFGLVQIMLVLFSEVLRLLLPPQRKIIKIKLIVFFSEENSPNENRTKCLVYLDLDNFCVVV